MTEAPNYGFNPNPEFTVNHISEYLATDNAPQRTKIIRAAKFPKKVEVAAYSQIRRAVKAAMPKPMFDRVGMELLADSLATKARRETGYPRDEALRCERAVRAFISTVQSRSFRRLNIHSPASQLSLRQSGVRIKVTLDAAITAESGDITNSGGIVLLYAFSADRGSEKERLQAISGLILWALETGQMEPLPRLCMAVDLAAGEIIKASASHARFRQHVSESCDEVAARWVSIEPPDDYDGPDWRSISN